MTQSRWTCLNMRLNMCFCTTVRWTHLFTVYLSIVMVVWPDRMTITVDRIVSWRGKRGKHVVPYNCAINTPKMSACVYVCAHVWSGGLRCNALQKYCPVWFLNTCQPAASWAKHKHSSTLRALNQWPITKYQVSNQLWTFWLSHIQSARERARERENSQPPYKYC